MSLVILLSGLLLVTDLGAVPSAPDDAAIDAFLAVLPIPPNAGGKRRPVDEEEAARLRSINVGKEQAIDSISAEFERCSATARREHMMLVTREAARRLGKEKLAKMIEYYRSDAFARQNELLDIEKTMTDAEQAEYNAISKAYPIEEFGATFFEVGMEIDDSASKRQLVQCSKDRSTALKAADLKE